MASSFQQTVSDFDLNFLDPTNESVVPLSKHERQRKAVLCVKKKTVATTYLIQKFYDKKELLEIRERQVLAAKEECRQLSIQYKDAEDRNNQLQRENALLQAENKDLLGKAIERDNQHEAMKSYCNQLQLLAKENETRIQSILLESNLEKSESKVSHKKVSALQKDNEELIKHILMLGEVVLGTRKANKKDKAVLEKYRKSDAKKLETLSEDEDEDSNHGFEDIPSPAYETASSDIDETNQCPVTPVINTDAVGTVPDDADRDFDSGTEATSNDTGRGSSLAFSGSDKCLPSPDYFINDDNPLSPGNDKSKQNSSYVNVATSPIKAGSTVLKSASPIDLDKTLTNISSPVRTPPIVDAVTSPMKIKPLISNRSTSPIDFNDNKPRQHNTTIERQSPPETLSYEHAASPIEDTCKKPIDVLPSISDEDSDDEQNANEDSEIEMIFTNMRMNHNLVTPLPMTPSKSRCLDSRSGSGAPLNERPRGLCPDAARIREENNVLHTKLSDLAKEVMSIKSLLINRLHNDENSSNLEEPVSSIDNSPIPRSPTLERDVQKTDDTLMDEDDANTTLLSGENNRSYSAMALDSHQFNDNVNSPISQTPIPDILEENNSTENEDTYLQVDEKRNRIVEVNMKYRRMSTAIVFENDTEASDSATEELPEQHDEDCQVSSATNSNAAGNRNGALKQRKLTRLQKIRKKLIPKNKIKSAIPPPKRLGGKSRIVVPRRLKDTSSKIQASKLNNQAAYEKAVKVMTELRNKEKDKALVKQGQKIRPKKEISSIRKVEASKESPDDINSTEICRGKESTVDMPRRSSITTRSRITYNGERISDEGQLKADEAQVSGDADIVKGEMQCTEDVAAPSIDNDSIKYKDSSSVIANPSSLKDAAAIADYNSPKRCITTRSRNAHNKDESVDKRPKAKDVREAKNIGSQKEREDSIAKDLTLSDSRKRRKRASLTLEQNKRVLRSSTGLPANVEPQLVPNLETNVSLENTVKADLNKHEEISKSDISKSPKNVDNNTLTCYDDLDMFGNTDTTPKKKPRLSNSKIIENPQDSVLCAMLEKYGVVKMQNNPTKTPPDSTITSMKQKIEDAIAHIIELPTEETKPAMDNFVKDIKRWHLKDFMLGLLKYMTDPARKDELLSKRFVMNSPAMTKSEQVLLYVFAQLKDFWPNVQFVNYLMDNIEYTLFRLNKTPDFEIIDSLSHFYAVLCRYIKAKNRLRLFMMDAMYCMQFKAVPLIRQCLDVWMHVLPLAHMGIAKTPLVTCLVYLLHFYKCEDKFNRVQDIRRILNRSYSYQVTEWNEPKILEMFRNAIKDHKDIQVEKKMLRMALIIMAKRHGPRWCEKNMIKGVLQSIIDDEDAPERAKLFCVSMLGPLMRPYPVDMKVNIEVVINQLVDRLGRNVSPQMQEAIITSLIYVSKHNQARVLQALLKWRPDKLSPDMESILRDFVRSKPIKGWQVVLSRLSLDCC